MSTTNDPQASAPGADQNDTINIAIGNARINVQVGRINIADGNARVGDQVGSVGRRLTGRKTDKTARDSK